MNNDPDARRGGRSAFAAAFLSFLFPGLGQAYAGRFGRALAFAALPVLAFALLAGLLVNRSTRESLLFGLTTPSVLLTLLALNILLLGYRLAAVVDAYRLVAAGGGTSRGAPLLRLLSILGLVAVLAVLSTGHVAAARFNLAVYDAITGVGQGDSSDPNESIAPESGDPTLPPEPSLSPGATPDASEPLPTVTDAPKWDGNERLNILLIGADRRPGTASYLTDTLIVASIDPQTRRVAMFSLPRDMAGVPLPPEWPATRRLGSTYAGKINGLYALARRSPSLFPGNDAQRGYVALKGALGELYGLDIKYYVALDFQGFLTVIDALGGVSIDVQFPVADDHYPTDDGRGALNLYIPPGIQYMDGPTALAYARARHQTSDFDRARRQQRVITSLRQQTDLDSLLAPGRISALLKAFKNTVRTDFPAEDNAKLISLLQGIDLGALRSIVFTPPTYGTECYPCPPSGAYILSANVPAIRRAVEQAFTVDPETVARRERIAAEAAKVRVLNGTTRPGQDEQAAEALGTLGVSATAGGPADRTDYARSIVRVYNGREAALPETISLLEGNLRVTVERVSDTSVTDDIVIITGADLPGAAPPSPDASGSPPG